MIHIFQPGQIDVRFPDVEEAEREPNGLLAIGGDLDPRRLLSAYRNGIFPWYGPEQPILWWSPDPRTVLFPQHLKVSRSLRKTLRQQRLLATIDQAFGSVTEACAGPRKDAEGTWLVPAMQQAYHQLHRRGLAHSIEIWSEEQLVGGLYGVAMGRVFFGESMFSRVNDGSKVALVHLVNRLRAWGYSLIDCQVYSAHLETLGAQQIPRHRFTTFLRRWVELPPAAQAWREEVAVYPEIPGLSKTE